MKDKNLFDQLLALETSQEKQLTRLKDLQENLSDVLEQNSELVIENSHLRNRLQELEDNDNPSKDLSKSLSKSRQNLAKLYEQGFHVCTLMYGKRRESKEPCIFCEDVIYGEHEKRETS